MSTGLLLLLMLCVIPWIWGVIAYGQLLALRQGYRVAFLRMDAPLKRRHDAVPAVIERARQLGLTEEGALGTLIAARNSAASARAWAMASHGDARALIRLDRAEQALTEALAQLVRYAAQPAGAPDSQLSHLAAACEQADADTVLVRHAFNVAVRQYNGALERFGVRQLARALKFKRAWVMHGHADARDARASIPDSAPQGV